MKLLSQLTGCFSTPAAGNPTVAMVEAAYRHHGLDYRYIHCEVTGEVLGGAVGSCRNHHRQPQGQYGRSSGETARGTC